MHVKKDTIVRTVVLFVALVNQVLVSMGKNTLPFEEEELTCLVSSAFTAAASLWAWWKNNSFTKAAVEADEIKKAKSLS